MRNLTPVLFAAAASVLSTAPAYADLGDQLAKLLRNDGAAGDQFGFSLATSGATAIVGARADDDNGTFSGSAYLFDISDPANPTQIAKLLPDDGAAVALFGFSVAISGVTAIVAAVGDDTNGENSGSAYLFDISDPANPTQIAKLLPDQGAAFDFFGFSVAIGGATAIVGAFGDDDNGTESGSAYLFDTATGLQVAKLLPDDGAANDQFGLSVAINGATAIVGAHRDDDNADQSGSAYLFDISDPGKPTQIAKLLPNDGAFDDRFGRSVGISGATAIVGAWKDDDNGFVSGSAYLFDISDPANPVQTAKLLADDGAAGDAFGWSVAISGATAIVGAFGNTDNGTNTGSAYLFDISDPGKPTQIAKLLADDGAAFDSFGFSVAISGATAIVGAYGDDDNGSDSGSAYLFDASSCPADLDNTGDVGVKDLLFLLGAWGPCPKKGDCPADFDGSGDVGVKDLLFLLGNWGPCR